MAKLGQHPPSLHELLCLAIKNKRLIQFEYQDCDRTAEPHDYGILNGMEEVLVYQLRGESKSKVFLTGDLSKAPRSNSYGF
ncbi:MAG TPA: hypothetical protein VJ692_11860 [Nitrospiraceae bacterium]|nr:hypothetical protein [Nitrospiraceae bacterium]